MAKKISSLIVVDSSVENYQSLLSGLALAADVLILDNKLDGVEQITGVLGKKTYTTVHIVAHGSPGCLNLGSSQLGLQSLSYYAQQLRGWFAGLSSTCTLLLYGCNVAQGDAGEEFITKLQQLTGVEIAASQTKTGNAAKGGNWELEYRTSEVELQLAFLPEVMHGYQGVLPVTITQVPVIQAVLGEPIIKDDTTDISVTPNGNKVTITGGTPVGDNLFFSFSEFNIPGGWSATFAGSDNVKNIIIRVTGNDVSSINGLIKSEIPDTNIYFINPAGVVFDTGASLQVSGDFHASTADYLKLGENERFYAQPQAGEVKSDAAPTGLGFLDAEIGTVQVFSQDFAAAKTLSLVGGEIQVGNDTDVPSITADNIKIAAVASAGEFNSIGTDGLIDVSNFTTLGAINWNPATINATNTLEVISNNGITFNNSGSLTINAEDIYISGTSDETSSNNSNDTSNGIDSNNSGLLTINTGSLFVSGVSISTINGTSIQIDAKNFILLENGATITSLAVGTVDAGDITIKAPELIFKRPDGTSLTTGNTGGGSVGGNIELNPKTFKLRDGSSAGGNITIDARTITLADFNQALSVSDIRKEQDEDIAIVFVAADFINAFNDTDGDSLSKIQITSLPDNGTLKLGDTAVILGQEIEFAEIGNLSFTPVIDFTGNTSFGWNGSDGTVYANQPAKVDLNIQPVFRLNQSGGVFQANKSASAQIQVRWLQSSARNYQFGFITVDDVNGGLDTDGDGVIDINPDDPNYQTAVLSRKQVIFNGNQSNSSNVLTRENAQGDFMVSEGESIAQLQSATLITGFNIFYLSDGTQTTFSTDNNSQIAVSEGIGYNQLQFTDSQGEVVSFELSPTPVLVTPGNSSNRVQAEISLSRIANFQNTIGVYAVDDLTGGIDIDGDRIIDFKPGDVGYSQAAVERAVTLSAPNNNGTSSTTVDLQGGQVLGLFLIANADVSEFLSQNRDNRVDGGPLAYFSFTEANPDKQIHIMQLGSGDTNIFGFEDLFGGGDRDFNDIIASVTYRNLI
ncbi:MAG: DUF4347 domain-containing protein [Calothrix sp. MO_192.B10]|nr:DUF4347 domain-containing protein [Calothrix sp. MO_192.B10]